MSCVSPSRPKMGPPAEDEEFAGNRVGVLGLEPLGEAFLTNTLWTMEIRRWSLPTGWRLLSEEHLSMWPPAARLSL